MRWLSNPHHYATGGSCGEGGRGLCFDEADCRGSRHSLRLMRELHEWASSIKLWGRWSHLVLTWEQSAIYMGKWEGEWERKTELESKSKKEGITVWRTTKREAKRVGQRDWKMESEREKEKGGIGRGKDMEISVTLLPKWAFPWSAQGRSTVWEPHKDQLCSSMRLNDFQLQLKTEEPIWMPTSDNFAQHSTACTILHWSALNSPIRRTAYMK